MSNTLKQRPLEPIIAELVNMGFNPKGAFVVGIQDLITRADKTADNNGNILPQAPIKGRTEGLGTTVGNIDAAGIVKAAGADFSRAYANKDTDHITDGTGSPLSGGKRGQIALDANNRLSGSFRANAVNIAAVPTSSTVLSNDGISTAIVIAAFTAQYGDGTVSYNSGSVDPGVFGGPQYIYADDPTFAGGAVTYQFSTTVQNQAAANGRVLVGSIKTINGTPTTGGGFSGGSSGGRGGRGFIQST